MRLIRFNDIIRFSEEMANAELNKFDITITSVLSDDELSKLNEELKNKTARRMDESEEAPDEISLTVNGINFKFTKKDEDNN